MLITRAEDNGEDDEDEGEGEGGSQAEDGTPAAPPADAAMIDATPTEAPATAARAPAEGSAATTDAATPINDSQPGSVDSSDAAGGIDLEGVDASLFLGVDEDDLPDDDE